ncbi:MAG: putative MarR family transcriptional regulator [Ilumatobacteraceae bacterium]|nr:putative MarR family transcriptional regulator [Ilumatobacteraceae bacterium]MCU1389193.1 putative MarR family transcriptional regulator [Ilumatobacteraceae bacterium]
MAAPDPERLAVWRSLRTAHSRLDRALTDALRTERELPLTWFETMNALQDAGGKMRVMELAELLVASPSSLSRQLNGMEDEGLIRRDRADPDDQRVVVIVLTKDGRAAWRRASTTYHRVLKRFFLSKLTESDVAGVQRALTKVIDEFD